MEKLRTDRLNECATLIQKNIRRFLARLHYLRVQKLTVMLQSISRRITAKNQLEHLRREKAATVIQKNWRRYIARKKYLQIRESIIKIQASK
jgi:myosin heavy subunit